MNNLLTLAAASRAQANSATLANVRDRCLRSEAAWLVLAARHERVARAKATREAAVPTVPARTLPETA